MSPKRVDKLSQDDINFLETVLEIQRAVDTGETGRVPDTERGEGTVNITAVTQASDLEKHKISYRMKEKDNHGRGFGMEGLGYLRIYDPEPVPERGNFSPRSVEITDKGIKALYAAKEELGMVAEGENPTEEATTNNLDIRLEYVEEGIESLEDRISRMEAEISKIQDSPTGAIDPEMQENLEHLSQHFQGVAMLFQEGFDIPATEFGNMDGERAKQHAAQIASTISEGDFKDSPSESGQQPP